MSKHSSICQRFLVALLACVFALTGAGCGKRLENEVKKTVEATFDVLKNAEENDAASLVGGSSIEQLESYGVDPNVFLGHVFAYLDYTIDEVTFDEEQTTATVKLSISNVNLDEAFDSAKNDFDAWSAGNEAVEVYQQGGEDALFNKLFEMLYAKIDELSKAPNTVSTTLVLVKGEEGWDIDGGADKQPEFFKALYGGGDLANL